MTVKELVRNNRSYRRFYQETHIGLDTLKKLVDLPRMADIASKIDVTAERQFAGFDAYKDLIE